MHTVSKSVGVKPISLCEANEQASFFKAALMHESELVNCETTPSERGLERTAETRNTHTLTHTLIWILFETILWLLRGHGEPTYVRGRCHARHEREIEDDLGTVTFVEVALVEQIAFELSTRDVGEWGEVIRWVW